MTRRAIPMLGRRFGRLVVASAAESGERGKRWRCVCDCGRAIVADGSSLRIGYTLSCGCLRRENARRNGHRAALDADSRQKFNIPKGSRTTGGAKAHKSARIADAFAAVFRAPSDTTHVDRPGARVVRGSRY